MQPFTLDCNDFLACGQLEMVTQPKNVLIIGEMPKALSDIFSNTKISNPSKDIVGLNYNIVKGIDYN